MVRPQVPRVLFVDAYDSFSNNIVSLLESRLNVRVTKIHHDTNVVDLGQFLKPFAAVVAGPGPGTASNPEDVGLVERLWALPESDIIPVFGICLGFQSLVLAFGGTILRLPFPRHGVSTAIASNGASIFRGCSALHAVQYHSLHATLEDRSSHQDGRTTDWWSPRPSCPDLLPLAWDFDRQWELEADDYDRVNPSGILMAVKHTRNPFYGIQFHPESVCSSDQARTIVDNWWSEAIEWLRIHKPEVLPVQTPIRGSSRMSSPATSASAPGDDSDWASNGSTPMTSRSNSSASLYEDMRESANGPLPTPRRVSFRSLPIGSLTVPTLHDALSISGKETVILDSEARQIPNLGDHSIIGLIDLDTIKIEYHVGAGQVELRHKSGSTCTTLDQGTTIFQYLRRVLSDKSAADGPLGSPFWGGLLGYVSYEAGLETIKVQPAKRTARPDVCFAFVERSIVLDHASGVLYVQSIAENDSTWVDEISTMLLQRQQDLMKGGTERPTWIQPQVFGTRTPERTVYTTKVRTCQDEIRAGNSYELCLTDQTIITSHKDIDPWLLYQRQRRLNPAPFSAFVRLGQLTLLSTSPERFLRWTRPTPSPGKESAVSVCQFRPIKGTVQKRQRQADGHIKQVSFDAAAALLSTKKEQAENLMIVDLIRHDLHGIVGSGNVDVAALMSVEEYESVYQLVSVIEGRLDLPKRPPGVRDGVQAPHGIDVLAASLPPGSMTGAPKKRACELLQGIEGGEPRSVYAGVLGYMCVGGGGDFSVVIRSAFRWDAPGSDFDEWRVGAGGAVTGLSTPEGEWEEMGVKLRSVLGVFEAVP